MSFKNSFKAFLSYCHKLRFVFIFGVCSVCIFAMVFALYDISLLAIWYPTFLCFFILVVFFIVGFLRFIKKHIALEKMKEEIAFINDRLPSPDSLIESDYANLLLLLSDYQRTQSANHQSEKTEISDYYSAWMHQIKTPIAVMQMLLQDEDTPLNKELLCELFHIEQYVEMVLYYIRLGDGASDLLLTECPLDPIIRKVVRKYAAQFVRKKIKLDYNGTDKKIITDEKWLSFIIEQLLSNAIKYTNEGVIKITVSEENILTVTDSGIGIAKEDLPRIFEKGFTGYNGRLDKKSTGIGLYLCKTASKKLGHKLFASSTVSVGSSFSVDLNSYPLLVE